MPKKYTKKSVVKKLVKQVKEIKQDIGVPETKYVYAESASPVVLSSQSASALSQTQLTDISVGDSGSERTGDSVSTQGIDFRLMYSYQKVKPNFLRIMLVKMHGLYRTIAANNLLNNYNNTSDTYSNAISGYNPDYVRMKGYKAKDTSKNELEVLYDKVIDFSPNVTSGTEYAFTGKCGQIRYHSKRKHIVKWNGSNSATGHIALVVVNGCSTTSGDNPQYGWSNIHQYKDL